MKLLLSGLPVLSVLPVSHYEYDTAVPLYIPLMLLHCAVGFLRRSAGWPFSGEICLQLADGLLQLLVRLAEAEAYQVVWFVLANVESAHLRRNDPCLSSTAAVASGKQEWNDQ